MNIQISLIIAFKKQKLCPGVYQYKYIVDGEWRFSPEDPTCHDENGNINNIIDTTNIERSSSFMGQHVSSARFLAMGSHSNSVNLIQQNLRLQNSNGSINILQPPLQTQITQPNRPGIIHPSQFAAQNPKQQIQFPINQPQLSLPQQYSGINNSSLYWQQMGYNIQQMNLILAQMYQNIQPLNPIVLQINTNMQLILTQLQFHQQNSFNPQMVIQQYERVLAQFNQLYHAGVNGVSRVSGVNGVSGMNEVNGVSGMNEVNEVSGVGEVTGMSGVSGIFGSGQKIPMKIRTQHNNSSFDKAELLIKAHIMQQNQTNFDSAFKEQAPTLPPHLLDVLTIKNRNIQNASLQREKEPHPETSFKSIISSKSKEKINMEKYEQNGHIISPNDIDGEGEMTLRNTLKDESEVLVHIFQPSHSLSPVDHVTLQEYIFVLLFDQLNWVNIFRNHVAMDNMNHSDKYDVFCITQRFKTKYTTFQFYTPKQNTQVIY